MRKARRASLIGLLAMALAVAGCGSGGESTVTVTQTTLAGAAGPSAADSSGGSVTAPPLDGSAGSGSVGGSSSAAPTTPSATPTPTIVPPVATVSAAPAFGTEGLSPIEPISITVSQGTIDTLDVTNPDGKIVEGTLSGDATTWTVGEVLGFGKVYTAKGTATGTDGKQVPIEGTFSTVTPATEVRSTVNPIDGAVVGVAAPVSVSFGVEPEDKAAVAERISITTDPEVEGAWAWIKHDDGRWALDYRPREYWPPGTVIHVDAKVYGVKFADGAYGASDLTTDFTIGRNQVVVADVNSKQMVVKRDGAVVATYPASYGSGANNDPNLVTRSGVHVVTEKAPEYRMNNERYGYTNSLQRWAVRISNNGEFIHANPDSAAAQGNTNVTHGCVNLSLQDAEAYFNSAIWGDPVEVSGTNITLGPEDGDIYIWGYSWDDWKAKSAG